MADAILWRIARRPYALERLGVGARDAGGRWNVPGTPVIYTGRTVAIAALESFVHLAGVLPPDLVLVRVVVPEGTSAETAAIADLPRDWNGLPPGPASMQFGTRWAREKRSLVLYVPSAIVPEETNGVLNPHHPEFVSVRMEIAREFRHDPRMFVSRGGPKRP